MALCCCLTRKDTCIQIFSIGSAELTFIWYLDKLNNCPSTKCSKVFRAILNVEAIQHLMLNGKRVRFRGALSRIVNVSLNSQNIYLCHRKPTNDGLFFVNNCYVSMLKLLASVFGCRWRGWKLIATWKIEAKLSSCFYASLKNRYWWPWFVFSLRINVISSFRCSKIMLWMD